MSHSTTLIIDGPLTGTGIIQLTQGSTLELNGSVSSGQTIQFASNEANLILNDPAEFLGTISSFSFGNTIDLAGISFGSDSIVIGNGVVSIFGGDRTLLASLNLDTATSNEYLQLTNDGNVGSQITAVACFLKDTLISTKVRKIPVQELTIGDTILGADNHEHIIKWIGRRSYRQPFKYSDRSIFPICICKSALSTDVPSANLYLSPEHCVLIENVLVPSKFLVNGESIRIVDDLTEILYYHIELESHDIILAEDTAVETFFNSGSREIFENHEEFQKMYASQETPKKELRFPKVATSEDAKWIRDKLAARVGCETSCSDNLVLRPFQGFLDDASRNYIRGWAWLPDSPNVSAELDVFVNNQLVANIIACQFRGDLLNAKIGNGCYGFELYFSPSLSHMSHCIDVRLSGQTLSITGCPVVLEKTNIGTATPHLSRENPLRAKMTGLVLDTVWPEAIRDAASNAVLDHIKIFQKMGFEIDFKALETCPPDIREELFKRKIHAKTQDQYPTVEALLQAECSKYSFVYFHRLDTAKRYAGIVQAISRDNYGRPSRKIYSVADLQFLRVFREAYAKKDTFLVNSAKALFRSEFWAVHQVDTVITHSSAEANLIREKFPAVIPHVVPWSLKAKSKILPFENRKGIGFVGSFQHSPNRDAIEWLLHSIMPLLWENNPEITLKIYGSGWTKSSFPKLDERIELVGPVENLHDALKGVRVTVAPLRFGAGLKGKVLESLALGIPCVMSPCAAEGIDLPAKYDDLVCKSPTQMALQLIKIHSKKRLNETFSKIGQEMIRKCYSERAISKLMQKALIESSPTLMNSLDHAMDIATTESLKKAQSQQP
jgi:glycosyltransferase involved in cell wall biosynthesis